MTDQEVPNPDWAYPRACHAAPPLWAIYPDHFGPGNPPTIQTLTSSRLIVSVGNLHEAWQLVVNEKGEVQWPSAPPASP